MSSSTLPSTLAERLPSASDPIPDLNENEMLIRPQTGWIAVNWAELLHFRELLYFLAWRDVKVRYKQAVLGVAWAVLQPLFTMTIFTVIFGRVAGIHASDGMPYPVFVFAGLIPWSFFSTGIGQAGTSLVNNQHLLTKVYFPRLFVPTAAVCAYLVDMAISFGLYAGVLAIYRIVPSWHVIFLPLWIGVTVLLTLGLSYMLAALTVLYRDFRYIIQFGIQILMYISPVIYPVMMVPDRYRWLLALNPLCGLIEGYRWTILGTPCSPLAVGITIVSSLAIVPLGMFYFRRTERKFADLA